MSLGKSSADGSTISSLDSDLGSCLSAFPNPLAIPLMLVVVVLELMKDCNGIEVLFREAPAEWGSPLRL